MAPVDRSAWRNTYIYASDNRATLLGGLWVAEGVTKANFYSMVEIFCQLSDTFDLHDESEQLVERDEQLLQPGKYYIVTNGSILVTDEIPLTRTTLLPSGNRVAAFCDAVRERDRRCVITARPAILAKFGDWESFEAVHIFPLAHEKYWNERNYGSWITAPPADESMGSINSVQNGILLSRDIRLFFDSYHLAINPDDNHKIVCFTPATAHYHIDGCHLDQTFLDSQPRPADELLRWHYRQAVLVNVKGLGEPCFEDDCASDSDMM